MDNETKEIVDSPNNTETTENQEVELEETTEEVDVEALKKENETLKAQKDHWRKKAAEKGDKPEPKPAPVENSKDLSTDDLYALMEAKVPKDDIADVKKAAALLNKPIAEALNDDVVKTILARKAEVRKTADVANTGTQRRVVQKATLDKLLKDLSDGKVPEPGSAEAEEIFWAKRGGKR